MKTKLVKLKEKNYIKVMEDTQFVLDFSNLTRGTQYEVNLLLEKEGVEAEVLGLYKIGKENALTLATTTQHRVPHTKCTTIVRGVLLDGGKSDYTGKIIIEKSAQQTSSYLDDSVLVVGEDTHNNSKPILEIEADDVKASHGATTGRIDNIQVYYLKSRGFTEEEAENLIVDGFLQSTLSRIQDAEVRNKVSATLGGII